GGGPGLGPGALTAYTDDDFELLYALPEEKGGSDQMFPGGNTTIARLMLKSLIPGAIDGSDTVEGVCRGRVNFPSLDIPGAGTRVRLSSTAIHVMHDGEADKADSVTIAYLNAGKLYKLKARSVVMAGGSWTAKHNVKEVPETHRTAYPQVYLSACMMANVVVRKLQFLYKMGMS